MKTLLTSLKWRYAVKEYHKSQRLEDSEIDQIKQAIQLSPSSYGLQLYKVYDVRDSEKRTLLQQHSYQQRQLTDASHLFVFTCPRTVTQEDVNEFISLKSKIQKIERNTIEGFGEHMKSVILSMTQQQLDVWLSNQVYIALGVAISMCASLGVDCTPMEGFENAEYDKILGLQNDNQRSVVVLTIGKRSEHDPTSQLKKVRKSITQLFEIINS
jgi:nitroreductase